jgi:hypothetical protein
MSSAMHLEHSPNLDLPQAKVFYSDLGFWFSFLVGLAGLYFSNRAFREARAARIAACEAGTTVKAQTVTIELTEIAQRLDRVEYDLDFKAARDLLNEEGRRIRRLIAPFRSLEPFEDACGQVESALSRASTALAGLQPRPGTECDDVEVRAVYFAMQGHFGAINNCVARIMGLLEQRTIEGAK